MLPSIILSSDRDGVHGVRIEGLRTEISDAGSCKDSVALWSEQQDSSHNTSAGESQQANSEDIWKLHLA